MARAAVVLAGLALLGVLASVIGGLLVSYGAMSLERHIHLAIPSSVLGLFAWTLVTMYFLGAFAWVREAVTESRLDQGLLGRARAIRSGIVPWITTSALTLIVAYVIGGGADTGAVPDWVHLAIALLSLLVHVVTVYRTIIFVGMSLDLQDEIDVARGRVPAAG